MRRFVERLHEVFERVGDRPMMRCGQESLSYAQVDEESARVYRYLKDQGIGRECFVHVFMPKGPTSQVPCSGSGRPAAPSC